MKYLIENYTVDNVVYKAFSPQEVKNMFRSWKDSLSNIEKKAFANYRKKLWYKNNINYKLRNNLYSKDSMIISNALKRTVSPEYMVVYRRIDRNENNAINNLQVNDTFYCADFKSTHVGKKIRDFWKSGHYMLILIPKNAHVSYINNTTGWFNKENELLIDKGQSFLLLEKRKLFNRDGYIVKLINDPNLRKEEKTMQKDSDKQKLKISFNGLTITAEETPYVIIDKAVKATDTDFDSKLHIDVTESVKTYPKMCYTTDFSALGFILRKLTLRSSSITNAKLNDQMEKERVGISQFAGSRFITCFSHSDSENVHFWYSYGGNDRSKKICLKLNNFASNLTNVIHTDYSLLSDDKKAFFVSKEYYDTINQNGIIGESIGLPKINTDFDLRNCIASLEMFDVEYLPIKDDAFTKDYSDKITVDFNASNATANISTLTGITAYNPNCLGKQKSNPWHIENESRILSCLKNQEFNEWNFIDLRLKEEFFRDMVIVLSPWLSPELEDDVKMLISESPISDEIKNSIKIEHSELEGTIQ